MKKTDILQSLALAAAIAVGPTLLTSPAAAGEPAGATKAAAPVKENSAQDKSGGATNAAPARAAAPAANPGKSAEAGKAAPATTGASPRAAAKDVAVGTPVFSADGKRVGEVKGVKSEASGSVQEIQITTGGLDGSAAKTVIVPGAKIAKTGAAVQLALTSQEIGKLPPIADTKG